MLNETNKINEPNDHSFEDKQSLIGLFNLLIKIDKRINPDNYRFNEHTNDEITK